MKKIALGVIYLMSLCAPAHADELSDLKTMFQKMQSQMAEMSNRIEELERQKEIRPSTDQDQMNHLSQRVSELEQADGKSSSGILSTLNPQVSVLGDFIYKADENGGEGD
ncbi:MAG: hypothetical protein KC713_08950, partial [Candidatus Omnitrophica bacterium]|nr:hypothetical protein [Candidatus Omnitrophota bacterium]